MARLQVSTRPRQRLRAMVGLIGALVALSLLMAVAPLLASGLGSRLGAAAAAAASVATRAELPAADGTDEPRPAGTSSSIGEPAAALAAAAEEDAGRPPTTPAATAAVAACTGLPPSDKLLLDAPPAPDIDALLPDYWRSIDAICPPEQRRYRPCAEMDATQRTSPAHVAVEPFIFGGLGVWNVLRFGTTTGDGQRKARGGDSWVATLRDAATGLRIPARVLDQGDGQYAVAFVPLRPGLYSLTLRLYYTLCWGYQEPFGGYEQQLKEKGAEASCYIGAKVPDAATLQIPELYHPRSCWATANSGGGGGSSSSSSNRSSSSSSSSSEGSSRRQRQLAAAGEGPGSGSGSSYATPVLRSDHHLWRNGSALQLERCCMGAPWRLSAAAAAAAGGEGTPRAIMWGDSTQRYPWSHLLKMAREPCVIPWREREFTEGWGNTTCPPAAPGQADPELEQALAGCAGGAPWTAVPVGTNTDEVNRYWPGSVLYDMERFHWNDSFWSAGGGGAAPPHKRFSLVYYVGYGCVPPPLVAETLAHINSTGDAVVFNAGPHCLRSMGLEEWRRYVDDLAALLTGMASTVVWRTSFALREHALRLPDGSRFFVDGHFQTEARRQVFDSYAEHALRQAGIRVWDIGAYGLGGGYRGGDLQHFDGQTTRTMNLEMASAVLC